MGFWRSDPPSHPAGAPAPPARATRLQVMVGRQPILDRRRKVYGYELLFRPTNPLEAVETTPDEATARVIADGVLAIGLDKLTHGRRAFIEMSPSFVQHDIVKVLPPSAVVLQLACDRPLDPKTIDACRRLKGDGYKLALSRFTPGDTAASLVPLADFIKVDFLAGHSREAQALAVPGTGEQPALVANRVDAPEVFTEALHDGFSHFQGYFFERASGTPKETRAMPRGQIGFLRLLYALNDPNLSLGDLEDLMKHDASLCYRMLRTVNSAAFAQTREITSIRQALLLLGRDTLRRWASLWVMADLGAESHPELVNMASLRGRFCELMSEKRDGEEAAGQGFLLGMCSSLDVILERPMASILEELPLAPPIVAALLGHESPARVVLECVMAYERGDWASALMLAERAGLDRTWLSPAYTDALNWVHHFRRSGPQ